MDAIVSTDMPFSEYFGSECCVYHLKIFCNTVGEGVLKVTGSGLEA